MNDRRLPIEPGHLDQRVLVQRAVNGEDGAGAPLSSWSVLGTFPMGRELIRGMERVQAGFTQSSYDARWLMHYRADMDPDLVDVPKDRRLVFRGRVQEIVTAQHLGRRDGIELTTKATTQEPTS